MKLVEPFRWLPFVLCVSLLNGCSDQPGELAADQSTSKKHTNRLSRETSPYLLLHAHNPVDWYAWGPEAFEKAKREKKVIFLSIGYSSCYWCHVMERLVFENEEIARYMNEHFVNIKVDREERPDVDDIYMTSLTVYFQMIGSRQGGGWPLSMFLTPEGKPFAGGTYFPPNDDKGRIGFSTVIKKIAELWNNHRKDILANADLLTNRVRRVMKPRLLLTPVKLERELVTEVTGSLLDSHDSEHGGVDFNPRRPNGPKFPVPVKLALLQYEIGRGGDDRAAKVLYHTLDRLAAGGIYDQLAGGFHRYSTDRHWLVPHFEKMLYDQAQLADVYVEAFRQTKKPLYRETAEGIFTYVLRGMTDASGGFYSALDAETESIEGKYYVWSSKQVDKLLGGDAKLFKQVYGMREPMVFEHGYVLHLPKPIAELAKEQNVSAADLKRRLADMRQTLLAVRAKRPPPLKDDKTLTSWNGLMIRAFANAGAVLKRDDYVKTAEKAAQFVMDQMRDKQGRLHRTYRGKQAKLNAYLDDYAFFVEGLLALHQASGNDKWLDAARKLTDDQIKLFWDEKAKGFFFTSHHHEELIARTKNAYDSVLPSGNSVSVRNLVRLAALTGEKKYLQYARETLELFAPSIQQSLRGMANMALAMGEFLDQSASGATRSDASKTGTGLIHDGIILPVAAQGADKKEEKITLKAYLSVDKLPAGGSCKIAMLVTIQDGWHINTNPAQPDFLKPTVLTMKSKHGSAVTVPNYPAGKKLTVEGIDEPLHVYEKRVVIYGTVNIPKDAAGKTEELEFQINYQACNNAKCLRPATMKLKGRLPVAAVGEPVKQINQKLFPKPTEKKKK